MFRFSKRMPESSGYRLRGEGSAQQTTGWLNTGPLDPHLQSRLHGAALEKPLGRKTTKCIRALREALIFQMEIGK